MAYPTIDNQSLPAIHNGPAQPDSGEKPRPAVEIGLYSEKNGEISRIFTDADLMKGQRLSNKWGYHGAVFVAIIKILNRLGYFYLEIIALY